MRTLTDQQNLEINCGGWALGKDIWYEPYEKELIQEELYTGLVQKIPYKIMRDYILQLTFDKIRLDNYANFICESSYAHLYEQAKEEIKYFEVFPEEYNKEVELAEGRKKKGDG